VLIESLGWRDAMAVLGILAIVVGVPTVWFLVKDRPEDVGENSDGRSAEEESAAPAMPDASETRELMRDPYLWLLGMTFGLLFSAGTISTIFTIPYATKLGLPLVGGAFIASMRAGLAAIGKIVLGTLSDRWGVRPVLYVVIATEVTLMGLLVQTREPLMFTILRVAIGFVGGSPLPLKAALVGTTFGRENFPAAIGLVQSVGVPFQLFMVPIAGAIYQESGTYAAVFGLTIPCFLSAAVCLAFIRPRASRPGGRELGIAPLDFSRGATGFTLSFFLDGPPGISRPIPRSQPGRRWLILDQGKRPVLERAAEE